MRFWGILVVFRLDLGQISFNLVENAFATRQLAFLATSIAFNILARACAEIKILDEKVTYVLRLFDFWNFVFRLSFFSFSFHFAAVIDLLLGLLAVEKTSAKKASSRRAVFIMEQPGVVAGNFGLSFSLNFFVHILGSIRPITLIWASLERSFPPAEVEYRWCQFWSKEMPRLVMAGTEVSRLIIHQV